MKEKLNFLLVLWGALILGLALLVGAYSIPWENVDWGKVQLLPGKTITVVGEAETKQKSQIATFTAGVSAINDDKDAAITEVNEKVEVMIESAKNFGIKIEDIKTQNLSVYQLEETYYEEGRQKTRPGQWRVSNSINITLRDVDKASSLADLLSRGGATNVYGPNFSIENTETAEETLLQDAITNARGKGEIIAHASGKKLGSIISVTEGYQSSIGVFKAEGIGGGAGTPIEPGTGKVRKTVTVVFELR